MRYLKALIAGSVALTMVGGAMFAGEDGTRPASGSAAVVVASP